ncbi:MAG: NUDIX hydrolase [Candidatus Magasanikbacteria bacterium]
MLNKKELKQLVSLLKKIDKPHEGLPQSVFDALCGVVPFVACELVVVSEKNEILMEWRQDKWWHGWHFPGGLLRFRERFEERLDKVAWDELGINLVSHKFLYAEDCSQGKRGHVISLVFMCKTMMKPIHGKFFKKMPKNIIEAHKELWERSVKFLT